MDNKGSSVPPNEPRNSVLMPPNPLPQGIPQISQEPEKDQFWQKLFDDIQQSEASKGREFMTPTWFNNMFKEALGDDQDMTMDEEAPIVIKKLCETFIQDLAIRSMIQAKANNKDAVDPSDVAMAIKNDETLFKMLGDLLDDSDNDSLTQEKDADNKQLPEPEPPVENPSQPKI